MVNTGDTAFLLVSAALVLLMTPGLAFFYAGMTGKKSVISIAMQSFVSMGISAIMWVIIGYSLVFSGKGPFIGNLNHVFLIGIKPTDIFGNTGIPVYAFMAFQMMFSIITPALATGAFLKRVTFKSYIWFLILWQILVYYPVAHMIWGGGIFQQWGVLDFAGGIVVHAIAGLAALASIIYLGRRRTECNDAPHNLPLVAIGTAMLWFGWFGFNAGSELVANGVTTLAFVNTDIAAAVAGFTWLLIEWGASKKAKSLAFMTGSVAGLATVTPAAGYVSVPSAMLIGLVAALVCYGMVKAVNNSKGLDDALDVFGVHGVGGILGILMLGLLGEVAVNPSGANGLFFGNPAFFGKETVAVAVLSAYSFVITLFIFWFIHLFTRVKVTKEEEENPDEMLHGEQAYL
ncbi:ammonium transporter [Mesoaciditoga sp.]